MTDDKNRKNPNQEKLDLILKWKDVKAVPRRDKGDHFKSSYTESNISASTEKSAIKDKTASYERVSSGKDAPPDKFKTTITDMASFDEDKKDIFIWSAEIAREIEEALVELSAVPIPAVYKQLNKIKKALDAKLIKSEEAARLTDEVQKYIDNEIKKFKRLPEVDDPSISAARSIVLDALYLYSEIAQVMHESALSKKLPDYSVILRLSDQAAEFLNTAKELLINSNHDAR